MILTCECGNPSENKETGYCASCGAAKRKLEKAERKKVFTAKATSSIAKVSVSMSRKMGDYTLKKASFIKDKICPITNQPAEDIHHKLGRIGFADQWAKDNEIPLLIDTRYWLGVSREGHKQITEHPDWAIANGYSLKRSQILQTT